MNTMDLNGKWDKMQSEFTKGGSWVYFNGSKIFMDGNRVDPIDFYLSKALDNVVLVRLLVEMGNSTRKDKVR